MLFRKDLLPEFKYLRKQGMQLASKMRFLSVQLEALLSNDLWRRNALQANQMARLLEAQVRRIRGVTVVQKVQANGVFARIPRRAIAPLRRQTFFYTWDAATSVVRWMCSWDTTEKDVQEFAQLIARMVR